MNFDFGLFFQLAVGGILSLAVIGLLRPSFPPFWTWAWQGVVQHLGLWAILHAGLVLLLGGPWFAMAMGLALLMLIVQVSNAKHHSLREAFVFQDFEFFTDAIKHPRLYIPFLGWWKFALIVIAVVGAVGIGFWLEATPARRFAVDGQLGQCLAQLAMGIVLLLVGRGGPTLCFEPDADGARLGLLACLWRYAMAERQALRLPAPWPPINTLPKECPDVLVVQSESFFDPRSLFPGIRSEVLAAFDRLRIESICHGPLNVPAWGANTVRSEFAFLSGTGEASLGVHRFNPYRRILDAEVVSLAHKLKAVGYRTVCIHPYPASFYGRDRVYPRLGFDRFIDIRDFAGAERFGPYVSDRALSDKVRSILAEPGGPLFVFVITMENHGPLHLEKPSDEDYGALYTTPPPTGCEDLTVYLRHLHNADQMAHALQEMLLAHPKPAKLCWYGDHVPIMPSVYQLLGSPAGHTEYLLWSNRTKGTGERQSMQLADLGRSLMYEICPDSGNFSHNI